MPVKPIALALVEGHEKAANAREAQRAAAERREAEERLQRGQETIDMSPLHEWFPDTEFAIVAYTGVGTSLQYVSNGDDVIVESDDGVQFGLSRDFSHSENEVNVYAVKLRQPAPVYAHEGAYYDGPLVHSALDVGLWLEGQRER